MQKGRRAFAAPMEGRFAPTISATAAETAFSLCGLLQ